jgi:hypothetical protein
MTPENIKQLNQENQEWMELQSMGRCMARCSAYFEELMRLRWHPDRVDYLSRIGYKLYDM